jgi:hypothetical protein
MRRIGMQRIRMRGRRARHAETYLFDVQYKKHHVFTDAGYGRELVRHIGDAKRGHGCTIQRGKQDATQCIAQCSAISVLKRADHKTSIVLRAHHACDLGQYKV